MSWVNRSVVPLATGRWGAVTVAVIISAMVLSALLEQFHDRPHGLRWMALDAVGLLVIVAVVITRFKVLSS